MPSRDKLYPVQAVRVNRREVLHLAVLASTGLAGILLFGCGGEEEKQEAPTQMPTTIAPSGFFNSDGLKIHYETFGEGKPIVLVHGWGADVKRNWVDTGWVEALQPVRRVVALDCRGHGQSDKPHDPELYSYGTMARDVLHLMDHLGVAKADLFGYSMGAMMGVYLLGHDRERFTSVIMGGIGDETKESRDACITIAYALMARDPSQITDPLGQAYRAYAESNPNNDLEALAWSALRIWPEGYPVQVGGAGLADVDVPVLIVNGEDDHPYVETDEKLAAAIPGAKLVTIPDTNHLSVVPDPRFKEEALAFLEQQ
jgi:pimeloyl-ACP methyl ester carboxylesterase